jgi:hypothetical protein
VRGHVEPEEMDGPSGRETVVIVPALATFVAGNVVVRRHRPSR